MELIEAVNLLATLAAAAASGAANIATVSAAIQSASTQGRTTLTPEETAAVKAIDDNARANLLAELTARIS